MTLVTSFGPLAVGKMTIGLDWWSSGMGNQLRAFAATLTQVIAAGGTIASALDEPT